MHAADVDPVDCHGRARRSARLFSLPRGAVCGGEAVDGEEEALSTTWFAKVDCNFHSNRKVMKAGRLGREVFVFVLCLNAQRGAIGEFPADDLDPWYVAQQLQMSEQEARDGIRLCLQARLIQIAECMVQIVGWTDDYAKYPLAAAEKQKRYRERHRSRPAPLAEGTGEHKIDGLLPDESNALPERSNALPPVTQEGRKEGREGGIPRAPADPASYPTGDDETARKEQGLWRGRLATATYKKIGDARVAIGLELGLTVPGFTLVTAAEPRGFRDLRDRIREEGADAAHVCARVTESLITDARAKRSLDWLSERAFSEGAWRTAKERVPTWNDAQRASSASGPTTFRTLVTGRDGVEKYMVEDSHGNVIGYEPVEANT